MKKALLFVLVLALTAAGIVPVWAEAALPGDLVTISESAFENDANLTGLWVCPQNVQTIEANAFSGTNLFALDVNSGAVSLAAQQLNKAAYIRLRGAQTQVNGLAGMRYLIGAENSPAAAWANANGVAFVADSGLVENNGFYYETASDGLTLLSAVDADAVGETVTIPSKIGDVSVTAISEYAFMGCTDLGLIRLPVAVEHSVTDGALTDCPDAVVEYFNDSNYPAVVPGIDFGGADVLILDYWSGNGGRDPNPSPSLQATYDYRDWINASYNVNLYQRQGGDWGTCAQEMIDYNSAPSGSLRIYIIEPGKVGSVIASGAAAPLNGKYVSLTSGKWNAAERKFLTIGGSIYGCYAGKSEPRNCVYFNKRVLEEAGIDWNSLYDMQKNGTWTWNAFENLVAATTRDTDNDGVIDVYGILGDSDGMYMCSVFSNGASFFSFDANGDLYPSAGSDAAVEALNWAKGLKQYWMPQPEGASWDWYKQAWLQGQVAFYVYMTYGGFNDNSEFSGMEDEWGCLAFPTASAGGRYINVVSDNIALIPACYDSETVAKLMLLYDLWTNPTPGYEGDYGWIGNKLRYTDRRAVMETYAMLREPEHCVVNNTLYLGSVNEILGGTLLWHLDGSDPRTLINEAMPYWQGLCDAFNGS